MLQLCRLALQIHDFLLQPDDARPLLFQEALILLRRGWVEGGLGQVQLIADGVGALGVAGGIEVGDEGLVAVSMGSARSLESWVEAGIQLLGLPRGEKIAHRVERLWLAMHSLARVRTPRPGIGGGAVAACGFSTCGEWTVGEAMEA